LAREAHAAFTHEVHVLRLVAGAIDDMARLHGLFFDGARHPVEHARIVGFGGRSGERGEEELARDSLTSALSGHGLRSSASDAPTDAGSASRSLASAATEASDDRSTTAVGASNAARAIRSSSGKSSLMSRRSARAASSPPSRVASSASRNSTALARF